MRVIKEIKLFDEATAAGPSEEVLNSLADVLSIDVGGGFSSASLNVQGKSLKDGAWHDISMIALSSYTVKNNIEDPGTYEGPIEGYAFVRINLTDISGQITVHARFINSAGGN